MKGRIGGGCKAQVQRSGHLATELSCLSNVYSLYAVSAAQFSGGQPVFAVNFFAELAHLREQLGVDFQFGSDEGTLPVRADCAWGEKAT
jgi:hypothetical protein